jgi:transcriptional regulator with XRE-family HTH domain
MAKLRLKRILAERGLSMEKFSRMADISGNTVLNMCNDPTYDPKLSMLNKVAKTLGISVEELLEPDEWEKKE